MRHSPPTKRPDRLIIGAAVALVALLVINVIATLAYLDANRWVDHTIEVRQLDDEWMVALLEAESGVRAYVASNEMALVAPFETAMRRERAKARAVTGLVVDNPTQVANVRSADEHALAVINRLRQLVALVDSGHREAVLAHVASGEGLRLMDLFRGDAERIGAEEERLLSIRRGHANVRGSVLMVGGALLAIASALFLSLAWSFQRERLAMLNRAATEASRRLDALSELASALAEARSPTQVADVVIAQGMRAQAADTCTIHLLDDSGTALDLLAEHGISPAVIDAVRRITATSGSPKTFALMAAGETTFAESEAEYKAIFPAVAKMKVSGRRAKAFWSVPLVVEGRSVGLLAMGFYDARAFSAEERAFVETLTKQCAQAIVRATQMEGEDEARRWFETTLASIGDAVIATDAEGRVTFINPVAERLTGWPEADARGRPLDDVFCILSEMTRKVAESPVAKVLREGRVVGLANHTILRSRRGAEIPIDDSAAPIRDASGRIFGVVLVFRDASDEKRAHVRREFLARAGEALVSSLDYRTILATVARFAVPELADWCAIEIMEPGAKASQQVAVAHVDPAKVKYARELAERYPPDPNAPTGVPQVIRSGKPELYAEIPNELLEAGAQDAEHLRIIRELRLASAMVVPLRGRSAVLGAMTFVYDAESGRHYTEADLAFAEDFGRRAAMAIENAVAMGDVQRAAARERELRDEAELANRAKDEFLAVVSHELRNPLNAILGWTVALRQRDLGEDIARPLGIIERNARAQTKLVEDVLDVSRIISGKLALKLTATDVAEAVDAAIETVRPAATAKEITITTNVEKGPHLITADFDRIQQVAWNVATNAVKFTPKGGAVSVRVYRENSEVCVAVADSGEGIRADVLPRVFDRFQQADASTTRRHGGLGLGLAIVRHIVTAHGGTVTAKSDGEGKGATFIVSLPARAIVTTKANARSDRMSAPLARLDGLRVLVVDDDDDARLLVGAVLRDQGAEVHLAGSAAEAFDAIASFRPVLLVSDIGMPEMDGYALIKKIRALPEAAGGSIPAIALTAYARTDDADRALAAGFQRYITKPVERDVLIAAIAELRSR